MREKIIATNKKNLISLISEQIKLHGKECDLNHIDISKVIDLSLLFNNYNCEFNGDISKWDVSNAKNVNYLFYNSLFNGDLSNWDVSKVTDMSYLFYFSKFNGDVSNWKPLKLENTENMFLDCKAPLPYWFGNNNEEVIKNIESYDLFNKMNNELSDTETKSKKMKI